MPCDLFSEYAVATQLCLGLSIVIVLLTEYLIEKCRKGNNSRTFIQFWFDSFKLCCGAFVTHGYNVLVALLLNTNETDECAVYMIAFYYEATGITLVQMLQYGLTKYSRKKSLKLKYYNNNKHTICSKIFFWISYPGHYTLKSIKLQQQRELNINNDNNSRSNSESYPLLKDNNPSKKDYNSIQNNNDSNILILQDNEGNISFIQTRLSSRLWQIIFVVVTITGTTLVLLFSNFILGYPSWISILLAISCGIMFATLVIATAPVLYQSFSWICIKVIERSLWTFFVWLQRTNFQEYSSLIAFDNYVLEAVLYIAIIPLIIGCIMFWFFSNIARLNIPFINIEKFASNVIAIFDLKEALKVGVYSTLLYNTILYIPVEAALRTWDSAIRLLIMMVIVPALANAFCCLMLYCMLYDNKRDKHINYIKLSESLVDNDNLLNNDKIKT